MSNINSVKKNLRSYASKKKAVVLRGFFKTGPGEYGEGDIFIGVRVPDIRLVAKKYAQLNPKETSLLIRSPVHEERLLGLIILVNRFDKGSETDKKKIVKQYLGLTRFINNWDLVDLTAPNILGTYLLGKDVTLLEKLARSRSLWQRRIAIVATYAFIRHNKFNPTLTIARLLRDDQHDLIHKAVGWMLREIGKKNQAVEEKFLKKHYKKMPRTMLRYAIERFPEEQRLAYLQGRM